MEAATTKGISPHTDTRQGPAEDIRPETRNITQDPDTNLKNNHGDAHVDGKTYADVTRPRQGSPPTTTTPTSSCDVSTAVNWQELIVKIAKVAAGMNIHPVVTTVANIIDRLFHGE
ncbi:hypothetical protein NDU88_006980 [Pleurodeles waltl]|uniref:Uncharacterized protein n=1 Tax=Pleurodeles waltl TaxID=8319 RepID=A0AAV7SRD6_PLEWA|nr:hypothetical protein NDU88_006980 [Pleurodeles waltl]